ncbi:MAG: beta-ketoacyl synthase N-terminal-like domain-containing protein, partial [Planctomycetota bacterium]|nr:beta-ketoacyl synthase N-terminal-like domain-containing protein [Planctomycetota bacterium]
MKSSFRVQTPIAVVGMACRLPGARNVDEFWQMLLEGRSAIQPIPAARFDRELYFNPERGVAGKTYADKAALIDYSSDTIPDGLLSAKEIANHDLSHLALCRVVNEAMNDAGLNAANRNGKRSGVYLGHATGSGLSGKFSYGVHIAQVAELLREVKGYSDLPPATQNNVVQQVVQQVRQRMPWRTAETNPSLHASAAAKLIGDKFRLDGPQMVFNSACASALQAIAHGMKALSLGRIDLAVAGGASCFHSDTLVLFSQAQSLSADGSFPFTESANGLIVGEGSVVFLLQRLDDAVREGRTIHAVLPGVGIASDGHGKSLWAPRGEGQIAAIKRAYTDDCGLSRLQYIEAHATSTNLGDKTEIDAISQVLREQLPAGKRIPIGGVKRNIGHTLEVAGAAGLLKVILAMRHGIIPPAVDGALPLTKEVDWKSLPVYVNDQPIKWPATESSGIRRAGVNAFGIGGLNVHLVVESYSPVAAQVANSVRRDGQIAIVGVGLVTPGAKNLTSFKELINSGRSVIGDFPADKWAPGLFDKKESGDGRTIRLPAAASVRDFQYDWRKHRIPPKQLAQANPLQFMMLDAVDQAFEQSGLRESPSFDPHRTGCIVGTQFGGDFATQLVMGLRLPDARRTIAQVFAGQGIDPQRANGMIDAWNVAVLNRFPALVDESGSFTASALASRITKSFDLMGGGIAVDASDLGAFAALSNSIDMLLSGACDSMVCVAGEHSLLPENYQIASLRGLLAGSADSACPFDSRSDGTVPGEGCVAFILERLEDARTNGRMVLGIIDGIAAANLDSRGESIEQAAVRAIDEAKIQPQLVRGVELIGLGVASLDAEETTHLARVYRDPEVSASAPTWQVGRLGSASGFVSLLSLLLALEKESLPGTRPDLSPPRGNGQPKLTVNRVPHPLTTSDPQGRLFVALSGAGENTVSYHVILQRGEPVKPKPTPKTSQPSQQEWQTEPLANGAVLFDATVRRREKMRRTSEAGSRPAPASSPAPRPAKTPIPAQVAVPVAVVPASPPAIPQKFAPPAAIPTALPTPAPAPVAAAAPGLASGDVEEFLINFVMEQTGYPREIVELDADMESDLGIDSIKKAQLFGELGEYFDVQASSDLSLDEFPTLRSVRDYLLANAGGSPAPIPAAPVATPAAAPKQSTPPQSPPPVVVASPAPASTLVSSGLVAAEVEEFLINFVMEQTGYPREIVELDADMESDLGIDSIKKAQLFGELGEYFDVQASSDLSLDEFPTLRTVRDYLLANAGGASEAAVAAPVASVSPKSPAPSVAPIPAPAPATLAPTPATPAAAAPGLAGAEVEEFLINFVMEQTGYPREIVELDADMESDLGIDSIKKAQLFGELGEYFDVQA